MRLRRSPPEPLIRQEEFLPGASSLEAVATLDDLRTRMLAHQSRKTPQLRALHSWEHLVAGPASQGRSTLGSRRRRGER